MKNFRDLKVWAKAHALTLDVYRVTAAFPRTELYGLVSQMRRSSASIGTNIAEGCGRSNNGDFHRFLEHAMGSSSELEYQVLLARDLGYMDAADFTRLDHDLAEVKRMLVSLARKVDVDRFQE